MTTVIKKRQDMQRSAMDHAVDLEMQRHNQKTEWDEILGIILAEFENEPGHYVITIRGKEIISRRHQFVNQLQITLAELRAMQ